MSVTTVQSKTLPYERAAIPLYPERTGLPKIQIPIALKAQASTTLSYDYVLADKIEGVMRLEIDSVYTKNLTRQTITDGALTYNRPYLHFKFTVNNATPGVIMGEKQKDPGEARFNTFTTANVAAEFVKDGIIVPHSPDANGLCDFHENPILVVNFKDPKAFDRIRLEVTDMYNAPVSFDDLVVMVNLYCMIDN